MLFLMLQEFLIGKISLIKTSKQILRSIQIQTIFLFFSYGFSDAFVQLTRVTTNKQIKINKI